MGGGRGRVVINETFFCFVLFFKYIFISILLYSFGFQMLRPVILLTVLVAAFFCGRDTEGIYLN